MQHARSMCIQRCCSGVFPRHLKYEHSCLQVASRKSTRRTSVSSDTDSPSNARSATRRTSHAMMAQLKKVRGHAAVRQLTGAERVCAEPFRQWHIVPPACRHHCTTSVTGVTCLPSSCLLHTKCNHNLKSLCGCSLRQVLRLPACPVSPLPIDIASRLCSQASLARASCGYSSDATNDGSVHLAQANMAYRMTGQTGSLCYMAPEVR
jgi:hypothetical protein